MPRRKLTSSRCSRLTTHLLDLSLATVLTRRRRDGQADWVSFLPFFFFRPGVAILLALERRHPIVHRTPPCSSHTRYILCVMRTLFRVPSMPEYMHSMLLDGRNHLCQPPWPWIEGHALVPFRSRSPYT